ncbi:MAG: ATP-binding cassette domain-containing protein [Pseudomonadota bacterium]
MPAPADAMAASSPVAWMDATSYRFAGADAPALDGVSAHIPAGSITGLVGPDGAGKTTLMRLLAGLLRPESGRVQVLGHDAIAESEAVRARIGYMPQRFGLYEDLSVHENLVLYARLRGLPREARGPAFRRLLEFTGLGPFTARLAGRLSGGMKQKLGLACALIRTPELLLLDEPSVGVDPISRRELWRMVSALADERIAVLWSTAYLDEAERCDDVILLDSGKVLHAGPPGALTERVEGRVRQVADLGIGRRSLLSRALEVPGVIDGVVQGSRIRLLLGGDDTEAAHTRVAAMLAEADPGARLVPAPPRFEDAYVDALGGGPGGRSTLAARWRTVAAATDEPVIEAEGLTRRFGDFVAAQDMTFSIPRGEIFGLLGSNGAGKSTTFRMLCGLLEPSAGSGRVAGIDLRHAAARARGRIGYMAQKFSLYGDLSVHQNLAFFAGAYGLDRRTRRRRVEAMRETFDLGRFDRTSASALPLGYKQRLALACAVLHEPDVLFLDEPTSGVDPITRREFWTHINGLVDRGVSVLVTTHFMDEAEYCDRIALIYRGRTIATGGPDALKREAASGERPDPSMEDAFIALVEATAA